MTETFKARLQGNPWDLWGLSVSPTWPSMMVRQIRAKRFFESNAHIVHDGSAD